LLCGADVSITEGPETLQWLMSQAKQQQQPPSTACGTVLLVQTCIVAHNLKLFFLNLVKTILKGVYA